MGRINLISLVVLTACLQMIQAAPWGSPWTASEKHPHWWDHQTWTHYSHPTYTSSYMSGTGTGTGATSPTSYSKYPTSYATNPTSYHTYPTGYPTPYPTASGLRRRDMQNPNWTPSWPTTYPTRYPTASGPGTGCSYETGHWNKREVEELADKKYQLLQGPRQSNFPHTWPETGSWGSSWMTGYPTNYPTGYPTSYYTGYPTSHSMSYHTGYPTGTAPSGPYRTWTALTGYEYSLPRWVN